MRQIRQAQPELSLQIAVKRFLLLALPPQVEWTASLAGVHLGHTQRAKAKASGLRPGFPDLMFIIDGEVKFIEMKTATGRLSDEQKQIHAALAPGSVAVCRSLDEVATTLTGWGVRLRARPFGLHGAIALEEGEAA